MIKIGQIKYIIDNIKALCIPDTVIRKLGFPTIQATGYYTNDKQRKLITLSIIFTEAVPQLDA